MKPYRNQELLNSAKEAEFCCSCDARNDGTVVPVHFNAIKYGKGTSQKSHDIVGFACRKCHDIMDGRSHKELSKTERELMIYDCIYKTFLMLLRSGWLVVDRGSRTTLR